MSAPAYSPVEPDRLTERLIGALLPATVAVAATRDLGSGEGLLGAEEVLVGRAGIARRHEFAAGRRCARRALGRFGLPESSILVGERREPLWPSGVIGSITHCSDCCAAAVAPVTWLRGLGIDVTENAPLPEEALEVVCSPMELASVGEEAPGFDLPRLLFSAKESAYKASFRISPRLLDFLDAEVRVDLERRRFSVALRRGVVRNGLPDAVAGRFAATATHLFTAVAIPTTRPAAR